LRDALLAYIDSATGSHPVEEVLLREDLYSGPYADLGPDLLVQPKPLWGFPYTDAPSGTTAWPTGAHRRLGVLLSSGGRTVPGALGDRDIADLAATALAFCGVSAPGIDGRSIDAIAGLPAQAAAASEVEAEVGRASADLSEEDQRQIAEHLRSLGYLE
jgi:hypothetical protein